MTLSKWLIWHARGFLFIDARDGNDAKQRAREAGLTITREPEREPVRAVARPVVQATRREKETQR